MIINWEYVQLHAFQYMYAFFFISITLDVSNNMETEVSSNYNYEYISELIQNIFSYIVSHFYVFVIAQQTKDRMRISRDINMMK